MRKLFIALILILSACGSESSVDVHQQVGDDNDITCDTCQGSQQCEEIGCFAAPIGDDEEEDELEELEGEGEEAL